ncbi:MAG TPA: hypothetical protein VLV30_01915 [Methanomicrobiales archaeon]|nr:hypothetical protein [Methanomicrobiales archaeon]
MAGSLLPGPERRSWKAFFLSRAQGQPLIRKRRNQTFIRFLSEYSIFHDAEKDPTRIHESRKTQDLY